MNFEKIELSAEKLFQLSGEIMLFIMTIDPNTQSIEDYAKFMDGKEQIVHDFAERIKTDLPGFMEAYNDESKISQRTLKEILSIGDRSSRIAGAWVYLLTRSSTGSKDVPGGNETEYRVLEGMLLLSDVLNSGGDFQEPKDDLTLALEALLEITKSGRQDDRPVMIATKAFKELCPLIVVKHTTIEREGDVATGVYKCSMERMPLTPDYIADIMSKGTDNVLARHFEFGTGVREDISKMIVDKILFQTGVLVRIEFQEMTEDEIKEAKQNHANVMIDMNASNN